MLEDSIYFYENQSSIFYTTRPEAAFEIEAEAAGSCPRLPLRVCLLLTLKVDSEVHFTALFGTSGVVAAGLPREPRGVTVWRCDNSLD